MDIKTRYGSKTPSCSSCQFRFDWKGWNYCPYSEGNNLPSVSIQDDDTPILTQNKRLPCEHYTPQVPDVFFRVPNNEEGVTFINLFRKFLNRDRYNWNRYGRASNRKLLDIGNSSHPRLKDSEWFGVYIYENHPLTIEYKLKRKK